ncbi:IclR family transcriptional regulator [Halalkaliarchaeum desulfuricum]|uniref:IclR family transcriptional regulator n=1 Tax=Halalkaliarchaeum desulfuricum TaxID=2055893 RepID=A0A343TMX5_9EURY|nr:IclR family transcriptional regulator [Halalkaliarchaeum desulfuricum]AUX10447.1 IclR family transcriptional regulator [Halalkaliarchaeum desulfuricum]
MADESGTGTGIGATKTTFAIVKTLHELQYARLTELAERVGIANSTAHSHLETLQELDYVIKKDGTYRLGLKFLGDGVRARQNYQDLTEVSRPVLEQLIEHTDEAVNLLVEECGYAVYLDRLTGDRGVPTNSWMGQRKKLHTLAGGKAILAHLPDETVDEIVETRGLAPVTDRTITTRDRLQEELESVIDDGVAFNDCESHDSIRAVASPVILEGEVQGSVSIAGPAKRLTGTYYRREIPDLLLGAVNEIELKLSNR